MTHPANETLKAVLDAIVKALLGADPTRLLVTQPGRHAPPIRIEEGGRLAMRQDRRSYAIDVRIDWSWIKK